MDDALRSADEAWEKWGRELVVYATALVGPSEAEDVVAEVFVRLLALDPDRLAAGALTRAYAFRVVLNEVRMRSRARTRREQRERSTWRQTNLPDHLELLADPAVIAAVRDLSVMQRAAVFLTYWEDLPASRVAELLGVGEGTVKRHLARGRRRLRKVLS